MLRTIRSGHKGAVALPEYRVPPPATVHIPLSPAVNRCEVVAAVRTGDKVSAGDVLAQGEALVIHAPVSGTVERADANVIVVRREDHPQVTAFIPVLQPPRAALPGFARDMGLAGMGGSMFPASVKLRAAERIHTLVINAVECEPGIQIDEALILHEPDTVLAGLGVLTRAFGIERTVLAVKQASAARTAAFAASCGPEVLEMPDLYPGGAEKLIVARLTGRLPPTGVLPVQLGVLVFSAASLWAIGRRILRGEPSILRPLTLLAPPLPARNLVVPVGTPLGHVLDACGVQRNPDGDLLIAGGLMMGRQASADAPVLKGTNAITVQPVTKRLSRPEAPCILCGSCFDVCPLDLHPAGMAERIRERRYSTALAAQLGECFLCGACSSVCPSDIPLTAYFHEGKAWIRQRL